MILVVDVGNTNITFGVYEGEKLLTTFRMTTKIPRTSDEYGIVIKEMLGSSQIQVEAIHGSIIASVVPNVMHALENALVRYIKSTPLIIGPGIKTGIHIATENPREIGADRIVDLVAGYEKYGGPVLVLDYGTATTYDLITEDGRFIAGVTAPGIRISAKALWQDAAKLPEIEIKKPKTIMAAETTSSMQAGLVYGQIGQAEYIIAQFKKETGYDNLRVVATGGLGRIIADETDAIEIYDPFLTLDGLRLIYERNQKVRNK